MHRPLPLLLALACGAPHRAPPPSVPATTRTVWDAPRAERIPDEAPLAVHTTIPLDLAILDAVGTAHWDAVATHLAADPRWRLVELDGAVVAFQRADAGVLGRVGAREGYRREGDATVRAALRFLSWDRDVDWERSALVSRARAADPEVTLGLWRSSDGLASALDVRGVDLSLDVYEARPGAERPFTRATLDTIGPWIAEILADDALHTTGFAPAAMPPDAPMHGTSLALTAPASGTLELRAALNPGAAGWSWLRILDARGRPWAAEAVAIGSREAIGWSIDPEQTFWMQGRFPVPPGPAFRGAAEVWFLAPGAEPTRLMRQPITVPAR